jgi:putative oxidoreductase
MNQILLKMACQQFDNMLCEAQSRDIEGGLSMSEVAEQRLLFPGLAGFYASFREIAYALVRIIIGYILFMHGWAKFNAGIGAVVGMMDKNGLSPAIFFAGSAMFLETVGAICVAIGLFTRFFAAALAIELAIAFIVVHWPKGFSAAQGGFEYVLLLGIVTFAIAIRGGGPYSVDRLLGKEL